MTMDRITKYLGGCSPGNFQNEANFRPNRTPGRRAEDARVCRRLRKDTVYPGPSIGMVRSRYEFRLHPAGTRPAAPFLSHPEAEDPNTRLHQLVRSAFEGDDTFEKKREVIDEYAAEFWRHLCRHESGGCQKGDGVSHDPGSEVSWRQFSTCPEKGQVGNLPPALAAGVALQQSVRSAVCRVRHSIHAPGVGAGGMR